MVQLKDGIRLNVIYLKQLQSLNFLDNLINFC